MEERKFEASPSEILSNHAKEGWLVIFSGFCLNMILGSLYLWGDLMIYIYSYLRQYDPKASLMAISWVFPLTYLLSQIVMSNIESLIERFSVVKLNFFGLLSLIVSLFLCSMTQTSFIFYGVYIIFTGIAIGILTMLPIVCGLRYFPENKTRVIGLIQLGGAFGCIILGLLISYFLNWNDLKPDVLTLKNIYFNECVASQVPKFLKVLAAAYMILGFVAISNLQLPKNSSHKPKEITLIRTYDKKESKNLGYWILGLFVIMSFEGFFFLIFYKVIGLGKLLNDSDLLWLGVCGLSLLWLMRVPWNFLKVKNAIICAILLQFSSKFIIHYQYSYFLGILLEFLSLAAVYTMAPRVFMEYLDFQDAKKFNKLQMISFGISAILVCYLKDNWVSLDSGWFWSFLLKDLVSFSLAIYFLKDQVREKDKDFSIMEKKIAKLENSAEYERINVPEI